MSQRGIQHGLVFIHRECRVIIDDHGMLLALTPSKHSITRADTR
jgi:hypothetical protein